LYVSLAYPWAHRTLIFRALRGLQDYIDVTAVDPIMLENGWEVSDPLYGFDYAYQLYLKEDPSYEGRVTVPIFWDKHIQTIVSNESSEIIRMFNTAFNHLTGDQTDYYPENLRSKIDAVNSRVYDTINNGVYLYGFATTQQAYEKAFKALFESLDWVEDILTKQPYLAGEQLTEADWRLFTTLIRFDAVYFGHFKTNRQQIAAYPAISNYLRALYQIQGIADTVNFEHIKTHYYGSHLTITPKGILPVGPAQDFAKTHDRQSI